MNRFFAVFLIICTFFNISCTHKSAPNNPLVIQPKDTRCFITYKNLVYGQDSTAQSMDLYLPMYVNKKSPIIILIHGGGWSSGNKDDFNNIGLDSFFTAHNCAVVTMNYRLVNSCPFSAEVDDIGLVIDYLKQKSIEWNIDPNRICLFGRSSGAHLALLYAYTRNSDKNVKAVIDMFGPTNLADSSIIVTPLGINVTDMLGAFLSNSQAWHDDSPIFYTHSAVPTVILQGTNDSVVYPIQSEMLEDSLFANKVPYLYLPWQGNGHGWNKSRWLESRDVTIAWIQRFL